MATFVVGMIIVIIVGTAIAYIIKEKKNGVKCIGCPGKAACSGSCASCSSGYQSMAEEEKSSK